MERNLDTEAAIIINDLKSLAMRIDGLQAHPRYTDALMSVKDAANAMVDGRGELHQRAVRARMESIDD